MKRMQASKGMLLSCAATAALTGCLADGTEGTSKGDPAAQVERVSSALAGLTVSDSPVVAWQSSERNLSAWISATSTGPQVAAQVWLPNVGSTGVAGFTQQYTTSNHPKKNLAISSNGSRFIIVYEDQFNSQDHDIFAIVTDADGNVISHRSVNFEIPYDYEPSVTFVPGTGGSAGRWLVVYQRFLTGGFRGLLANWVDADGNVSAATTLAPLDQSTIYESPSVVFGNTGIQGANYTGRRLLVTWNRQTTQSFVGYRFFDADTLLPGAAPAFTGGTLATVFLTNAVASFNTTSKKFALAWRDSNADGTAPKLRFRAFPAGCEAMVCAGALVTPIAGNPPWDGNFVLKTLSTQVTMSPLNDGFSVVAGCSGTDLNQFPNGLCEWYINASDSRAAFMVQLAVCTSDPLTSPFRSYGVASSPDQSVQGGAWVLPPCLSSATAATFKMSGASSIIHPHVLGAI